MQERTLSISRGYLVRLFFPLFQSNDEGYIENAINNSDTEIVSEDESAASTDIIRKQEIGYQCSSLSVQKHQSTLWIPKARLKPMR